MGSNTHVGTIWGTTGKPSFLFWISSWLCSSYFANHCPSINSLFFPLCFLIVFWLFLVFAIQPQVGTKEDLANCNHYSVDYSSQDTASCPWRCQLALGEHQILLHLITVAIRTVVSSGNLEFFPSVNLSNLNVSAQFYPKPDPSHSPASNLLKANIPVW